VNATAPKATTAEPLTVASFLETLRHPGEVFELRALNFTDDPEGRFASTLSGFFNSVELATAELVKWSTRGTAEAWYVTLNPLGEDLLALAHNRMKPRAKVTAADSDVLRRTRLLIDVDPVRKSGISATAAELALAETTVRAIYDFLTGMGFPEPIRTMSGNGAGLIYAIDLPTDDGGLVARVLKALAARFDTADVKVDISVHNASRITKVLGTVAAKGENMPERPHRMSRFVSGPETLEVVPEAMLVALGGEAPAADFSNNVKEVDPHASAPRGNGHNRFAQFVATPDGVAGYLRDHGADVRAVQGNKIILGRCPVRSDCESLNGSDIAVLVEPGGKIIYKNLHNRGEGLTWADVREKHEPGYKAWVAEVRAEKRAEKVNAGRADLDNVQELEPAPTDAPPAEEGRSNLKRESSLRTDIGNAARFAIQQRHTARYVHPWGKWILWTGKRWKVDDRGRVVRLAKRTALSIYREAADAKSEAKRTALSEWATKSQTRDRLNAMMDLAKSELAVTPDELDAHPMLFNCANGTVDLRTGELHPHRREDYLTKLAGTAYDRTAQAPIFRAFLARIFRTHPALIGYVQRAVGYGATGSVREQVLFFLYGTGANGKTTLLDAVTTALGDYAGKADRELLTGNDKHPSHPTNVADLMGRRLVVCSEGNDGALFDEAKLKDLTGETKLKARYMRQDFFEFVATHKVFKYSNHKPTVRGTDHGFWRRIRLIPFIETISEEEKDTDLPAKLDAELPGIIAWIVEGARLWWTEGLGTSPEVGKATEDYRKEMDRAGAFLEEMCGPGEEETARRLYDVYLKWSEDNGEKPYSQTRFGRYLREHGYESERDSTTGRKKWLKIAIKARPPGE
jgi:putative DNA primase/helicase